MYTKSIVSYLPDRMYFADWMLGLPIWSACSGIFTQISGLETAEDMLERLEISGFRANEGLSKGTKEKVGLALVMSRGRRSCIFRRAHRRRGSGGQGFYPKDHSYQLF